MDPSPCHIRLKPCAKGGSPRPTKHESMCQAKMMTQSSTHHLNNIQCHGRAGPKSRGRQTPHYPSARATRENHRRQKRLPLCNEAPLGTNTMDTHSCTQKRSRRCTTPTAQSNKRAVIKCAVPAPSLAYETTWIGGPCKLAKQHEQLTMPEICTERRWYDRVPTREPPRTCFGPNGLRKATPNHADKRAHRQAQHHTCKHMQTHAHTRAWWWHVVWVCDDQPSTQPSATTQIYPGDTPLRLACATTGHREQGSNGKRTCRHGHGIQTERCSPITERRQPDVHIRRHAQPCMRRCQRRSPKANANRSLSTLAADPLAVRASYSKARCGPHDDMPAVAKV